MAVGCGLHQAIDAISAIVFPLADPRINYARGWNGQERTLVVLNICVSGCSLLYNFAAAYLSLESYSNENNYFFPNRRKLILQQCLG